MHAVSTPEWKNVIPVFISNAANLMRSIKDLLKALQLAQITPNNIITTTTTEDTPLVQPHQQVATVNKVATCFQRQPITSVTKTTPPISCHEEWTSTLQLPTTQRPLVLDYSSPNVPALVPSTATAAAQSPPTCKPLRKEDQATVCRYLHPLRSKWKTLGTFLCVDYSSLEEVQADSDSSDERLAELVALWLRQATPPPTWQALADAVQYFDTSKAEEMRREQLM